MLKIAKGETSLVLGLKNLEDKSLVLDLGLKKLQGESLVLDIGLENFSGKVSTLTSTSRLRPCLVLS